MEQNAVETFRAGAAHEPLRNPIRLRRAKWRANDLYPFATEHVVKLVGEFPDPIANQEPPLGVQDQLPRTIRQRKRAALARMRRFSAFS